MRNTKSAFTLVELIVVITILAILGTIAFISLQGYSADARNSKRTSDLNNIASSLNIKLTTGMGMLSLMADDTSALTTPSIGGSNSDTTNYNAGKVNYAALGMKASEFQDPTAVDYVAGGTTKAGGAYQLASIFEGENSTIAKVIGDFNPRGAFATSTGAINAIVTTADTILTLTNDTDAFKFKVGDTLTDGTATAIVVSKVSSDGLNLTVSGTTTIAADSIGLAAAEVAGLIDSNDTANTTTPVIDGSGSTLPY